MDVIHHFDVTVGFDKVPSLLILSAISKEFMPTPNQEKASAYYIFGVQELYRPRGYPYPNFMAHMSPLIPPDEFHSHPSPSPSPSSHPKITSDPRNLRLPITPDDESSSSDFQTSIRPQLFRQRPTMRRWGILLKGT
ncbi:hypothetical protein AZE42_13117 [Rhizopogon vesiculosus]|uniref:Uncharacterized protein n=1 Tax=Rhizopogon vesiculosus TaxID=180088 RepID=A0A1J8QSG6_9AGAM|nr:hypothetical protein AZE42_13117 [Rhizopogon vesiculosus]